MQLALLKMLFLSESVASGLPLENYDLWCVVKCLQRNWYNYSVTRLLSQWGWAAWYAGRGLTGYVFANEIPDMMCALWDSCILVSAFYKEKGAGMHVLWWPAWYAGRGLTGYVFANEIPDMMCALWDSCILVSAFYKEKGAGMHVLWWPKQHLFYSPLSGTTWVSQYQKGKIILDYTEARDGGISLAICNLHFAQDR